MRLLHTADWHLGASLGNVSRADEHDAFFEWLLETVHERQIHALLVAGDVFHYTQPSADALRQYYKFLARLDAETDLQKVIIIGGNHDSAPRLDAAGPILEHLKVHVVGGLGQEQSSWSRALCPISNADGQIECVVAAVPYMHEYRLGIRTTKRDPGEIRDAFKSKFQHLYKHLADQASVHYPGQPLLAMGHLTCEGAAEDDYHTPIHQIATIGGLPPTIFDPRYLYVALGHIHRMYQVGESAAWYSGSPVALDISESRYPHFCLVVDLDDFSVDRLPVPTWREMVSVSGDIESVLKELQTLTWSSPMAPLVYAEVSVSEFIADVEPRIREALKRADDVSPHLVSLKQTRVQTETMTPEEFDLSRPLRELKPEEVFEQLYRTTHDGEVPPPAIMHAFRSVLGQNSESGETSDAT